MRDAYRKSFLGIVVPSALLQGRWGGCISLAVAESSLLE